MAAALETSNYLEKFFPAGPFTDEHQLVQLRLLARQIKLARIPQIQGVMAGSHLSKQKGRGLDLDQLRLYQAGDDIRSIDWRVTARTQKPHTRIYKEERERPVFILCDQRSPMFFGTRRSFKSVLAAQCAAVIAWAALGHGDRVGALVLGDESEKDFRPKQRAQHVLQILRCINEYNHKLEQHGQTEVRSTLSDSLNHLKHSLKPGTTLYLISDFFDLTDEDRETLFSIKRHNHVVALQMLDPLEREAPPPGLYGVSDGINDGWINTQGANAKQAYKDAVDVWHDTLARTFRQLGINHWQLSAAELPLAALKLALEQK